MAAAIEAGVPSFQGDDSGAIETAEQQRKRCELVPPQPTADTCNHPWPAVPSACTYEQAAYWYWFQHSLSQSRFQATPSFPWTPAAASWLPACPTPYFVAPHRYLIPLAHPRWSVPGFPNGVAPPTYIVPQPTPKPTTTIPDVVFRNFLPPRPALQATTATISDVAAPKFLVPHSAPVRTATIPNVTLGAFGVPAWYPNPPVPGRTVQFSAGGAKPPLPSAYDVQRVQGAPLFMMRSTTRRKLRQPPPASETPPRPHRQHNVCKAPDTAAEPHS
nr:uncharacterized protein LOC126532013 [Dermacentor andersoni]